MKERYQYLFEFERPEDALEWQPVDDVVMGGRSASRLLVEPGSVGVFSGEVSLADGGGFASVRTQPVHVDLSGAAGLEMRFCGDAQRYKLRLRTDPELDGVAYEVTFGTAGGDWRTERFPFGTFRPVFRGRRVWHVPDLDPSSIYSFGLLIADGQEGPFRLAIDWLRAYRE